MANPPLFPQLAGQGWSVHKRPTSSTRVASHVSGREVRVALFATALYEFEVTFDGLDATGQGQFANLGSQGLQQLMGLFLSVQGQFGTFLYEDPTDNTVLGQELGLGDGATIQFTFARTLGGWNEVVGWVTNLINVYVAGSVVPPSSYFVIEPNTLVFNSAPASGQQVLADFSYAFNCRFLSDQADFKNFMQGLWSVSSLKFRSVKP